MNFQIRTVNNFFVIYLCLLILNLCRTGSHASIVSKLEKKQQQISYCSTSKFQCESGQCIDKSFLCDGISDCKDGSDETQKYCQNTTCTEQFFQCDYGACINKEYECDGLQQCNDGSDEKSSNCNTIDDKPKRTQRAAGNSCPVPNPSPDKTITYLCDGKESTSCGTENGFVPEFTVALMQCNQNYYQQEGTQPRSICHNKIWIPPIDRCYKICDKLTPENVELQCFRKGVSVSCDENSLTAGTKIRPTCISLHKYKDFTPNYLEMTCRDDGTWDNVLFKCTPECGRPYTNTTTLIQGGVEEKVGNSPWHVAIYNREKVLICGGTIISPYLILTAAHCFRDRQTNVKKNASEFEVVVGKFTRDYSKIDNSNQQTFKVREIRESNKGYIGKNNYFTGDIAVLILDGTIPISSTVLPACVDWIELRNRKSPPEGVTAKVSGWGMNEKGVYSETLRTAELPYISRERCLNIVPNDFKAFVTFDKFCAGSETGAGVLQGDSGGGLLFQKDYLYYLRGIVSTKQASSTAIATFTDLADHIEWIIGLRNEIEQEMENKNIPNLSNLLREANSAITSNIKDLPKLLQLSERLEKAIVEQKKITDNLKSQAQSVHETLKNSLQLSAIEKYTDGFLNDRLSTYSQFGSDLAKLCFQCFNNIMEKTFDNVLTKLGAKQVLNSINRANTFRSVLEKVSISNLLFEKMRKNGDFNTDSVIQLADLIKETMEHPMYESVDSSNKGKMRHIQYNIPKSIRHLVFSTKICIRNVEYNEYLFAASNPADYYENDRRLVFTWKGGSLIDLDEPGKFAWKLERYGDGYQILNGKYGDRLYSGNPKWDDERRYAFTWRIIEDGAFKEGAWKFEPDGDYVYIKNTFQNEYLFADFDRIRDGNKRYVFTFVPKRKPSLDSKWMIISCNNQ